MSKSNIRSDEDPFLDAMAALMAPWGWPRPVGRVYAYLLLRDAPATLDTIAADLGIAKSNASVAARTLEQFGNARRVTAPGSKRIYYAAPEKFGGSFESRADLLGQIAGLLDERQDAPLAPAASARLTEMSEFYRTMRDAMRTVIAEARKHGGAPSSNG